MWINVRVAKQLHAAGHSFWTLNQKARFAAWKGTNLVLLLGCAAIFAATICALIVM
jgi:hypothetical protein